MKRLGVGRWTWKGDTVRSIPEIGLNLVDLLDEAHTIGVVGEGHSDCEIAEMAAATDAFNRGWEQAQEEGLTGANPATVDQAMEAIFLGRDI